MDWAAGLATYGIIWWLVLFMVLPWGVRNRHETGEGGVHGEMPGVPVKAMMWRKVAITTVVSAVVFAVVWWLIEGGLFSFYGPR